MHTHTTDFQGLGIAPKLLEILNKNSFKTPTPIQAQSIPVAIEGNDVIGIAQTGTGKTLAFGIPMLQSLVKNKGKGLVLVPTRELAQQVDESIQKIGKTLGLRTCVMIGGEEFNKQLRRLRQDPHVFIATPGRMIDHLERGTLKLNQVKVLVLDEADRMFDMGFAPQIKIILKHVPAQRQTMLFSATMPPEIVALATSYMKRPTRVEVAPAGTTAKDVSQELFFVDRPDKLALLEELLGKYQGSVLVFTRTKYEAKKVSRVVKNLKHTTAEIHSNRSLSQRREALGGFKLGKYRVLVATDIAARGIDVSNIELVINYDLPATPEDYVHRIGRTGRAGAVGHAVSFATPDQRQDVRRIERVIKRALPISQHALKGKGRTIAASTGYNQPRPPRQARGSGHGHRSRNARPAQSRLSSNYPEQSRPGQSRPAHGRPSHGRPAHSRSGSSRSNSSRGSSVIGFDTPSGDRKPFSKGGKFKKSSRDRHPAPRPGRYPKEEEYTPFRMERIIRPED